MIVWLGFAFLALIMLAIVLLPLLRPGKIRATRSDYDLAVYRQQLKEVQRDQDRGLLNAQQAESARAEIERRMLGAVDAPEESEAGGGLRSRIILAGGLIAVMPISAIALYLAFGTPGLPDQPFAKRPGAETAVAQVPEVDIEAVVAELAQRVEANSEDLEAWLRLGRIYVMTDRPARAVEALTTAMELSGERPDVAVEYGEALVMMQGGQVTPTARAAFRSALAGNTRYPRARYYLALADAQEGDWQAALDSWTALARDSTPDAPWLPTLLQRIAAAAAELDIDLADIDFDPAPPAKGPSEEMAAELAAMSPAERDERIAAMVTGLAARLEANPQDLEGWLILARAYRALDRSDEAQGAILRVAEIYADAPVVQAQIREVAQTLGLEAPGGDQVATATEGIDDSQMARITGMVGGLAARLEGEPQDLQGWMMLIRSYRVLGENGKSEAAAEQALAVFAEASAERSQIERLVRELGLAAGSGSEQAN